MMTLDAAALPTTHGVAPRAGGESSSTADWAIRRGNIGRGSPRPTQSAASPISSAIGNRNHGEVTVALNQAMPVAALCTAGTPTAPAAVAKLRPMRTSARNTSAVTDRASPTGDPRRRGVYDSPAESWSLASRRASAVTGKTLTDIVAPAAHSPRTSEFPAGHAT